MSATAAAQTMMAHISPYSMNSLKNRFTVGLHPSKVRYPHTRRSTSW
jgi:hypothetical protein